MTCGTIDCEQASRDAGTAAGSYSLGHLAARWGAATAPLVPRAYRRAYHNVLADSALRIAAELPALTLGQLNRAMWESLPWRELDEIVFSCLRRQVAAFPIPEFTYTIPAGTSAEWLLTLPLRPRTRSAVGRFCRQRMTDGRLLAPRPAADLLQIKSAGKMTLLDFLCVLESAERQRTTATVAVRGVAAAQSYPQVEFDEDAREERRQHDFRPLRELLAVAQEFRGAKTFKDAIESDLGDLAKVTGMAERLDDIELGALTGGLRVSDAFLVALASLTADLPTRSLLVLDRRLFRLKPRTLEEIGVSLGVTRQRVAQVEKRLKGKIEGLVGEHLRILAGALRSSLDPVLPRPELDQRVERVFAGTAHPNVPLAHRMLRGALGYRCVDDICFSKDAAGVVDMLRAAARERADDAGLIDEGALQDLLPSKEWLLVWPRLVELCRLHRINGHLALRDTKTARIKVAVLEIGEPATKEEIAERSGLPGVRVANYLGRLPSVVRADMTRWGLSDWVEDEYDGVAGEILQRIDEDGGATSLERLFEELPRLFNLKVETIRAYLGTPQFLVRDGFVSKADSSVLQLRPLDDVVDGRDSDARAYCVFRVEERYFDGFSLAGVAPEVAQALGCKPNGRARIRVLRPHGCGQLSLIWSLTSLSGASIGYLAEPLRRLRVEPGDRVRLVLRGKGEVELQREESVVPDAQADGKAAQLLERLKARRRVL